MAQRWKGSVGEPRRPDGKIWCAIYARYSSDNQSEHTIDVQIRNCREAARRKGWVIVEHCIYIDQEKSGTTLYGRNGFAAMMEAVKSPNPEFDYILVDDSSRFGRNKADTFTNLAILDFFQIYLLVVNEDLDSAQSWFEQVFHHAAQRDAQYSKTLSYKVKASKRERFRDLYHPGNRCFGYANQAIEDESGRGKRGRASQLGTIQVIYEPEGEIVRRIFRCYAAGMTMKQIASMLNAEGVSTATDTQSGRSTEWQKSAITEMLHNERYIGKLSYVRSEKVRNPLNGRLVTRKIPKEEWLRRNDETLRIVPQELRGSGA